jgi:hypothetical protein
VSVSSDQRVVKNSEARQCFDVTYSKFRIDVASVRLCVGLELGLPVFSVRSSVGLELGPPYSV